MEQNSMERDRQIREATGKRKVGFSFGGKNYRIPATETGKVVVLKNAIVSLSCLESFPPVVDAVKQLSPEEVASIIPASVLAEEVTD